MFFLFRWIAMILHGPDAVRQFEEKARQPKPMRRGQTRALRKARR